MADNKDADNKGSHEQERAKFLHDIATPLTGIQLTNKVLAHYLPILLDQYNPSAEGSPIESEHLELLKKAPENIQQMVEEAQQLVSHYGDQAHTQAMPTSPSLPNKPKLSFDDPLAILVAEDNAMHRRIAQKQLAAYQLDIVSDGQQALDAVTSCRYDLVILDLYMPVLNGEEVVAEIKAQGIGQPWIIACSNKPLGNEEASLQQQGFDGFANKPLSLDGLKAALNI